MRGVLAFAKSLDTLGFFTNTARDMLSLWHALDRHSKAVELSVLGVVILGEPFTAWMAAGTVLVLVGVWQLARAK